MKVGEEKEKNEEEYILAVVHSSREGKSKLQATLLSLFLSVI